MPPRTTVLSRSFGFSRKKQVDLLNKTFGNKIVKFVTKQRFLPQQWIKLLSRLDQDNKSWNLIIDCTSSSMINYHLHVQHLSMGKKWKIGFEANYKGHEKNVNYAFSDKKEFYRLLFFCLVRIPKTRIMISNFNLGRRKIILDHQKGWTKEIFEKALEGIPMSKKELHLPIRIGDEFSVPDNFLTHFLNTKNKISYFTE